MSIYAFLGPSLSRSVAKDILDAVYLPPISTGDLYVLVSTRAQPGDHVAIIDGLFQQAPAVWHKEILYALSRGVHVYGAASMGALRAAELNTFGMRGVGEIFEAFRTLRLDSDDEVAVTHADAPNGYRSLSTALVSIRFAIDEMIQSGEMSATLGMQLVAAAAALPYPRRSWRALLRIAEDMNAPERCLESIRSRVTMPDAKARDAAELLTHLRKQADQPSTPHRPVFVFQNTSFWAALTQAMALRVEKERFQAESGNSMERNAVAKFVRGAGPDRDHFIEGALLDRLAVDLSTGFSPTWDDLRNAEQRIAHRNGIRDSLQMKAWRAEQSISDKDWHHILTLDSRREWLRQRFAPQLDQFLISRLKAEGRYNFIRQRQILSRELILIKSAGKPSLQDFGLTPNSLQSWYTDRFGKMLPDPVSHARSLNFTSLREFVDILLECYLADAENSFVPQEQMDEVTIRKDQVTPNDEAR